MFLTLYMFLPSIREWPGVANLAPVNAHPSQLEDAGWRLL